MRIGVKLPSRFDGVGDWLADAQAYETAGADSLWVSDGLFRPAGREPRIPPGLDCWSLLAAAAVSTSKIRLGTSVAVAAQWPPPLFAQTVTTLEHLSRGRLLVGVGAGWERVQLEANGVPFADRGRRLEALLETARSLWSGNHRELMVARAFREGGPPVLVGATSEPGYRRAARLGDGFISVGGSPDEVRQQFERVLKLRRGSRDEAGFELWVQVRPPENRAAWQEALTAYGEAGAGGLIVGHAPNLLDILRNPAEDDRQDLHRAVG